MFSNITLTNPAAVIVTMISMVVLFVVKEFANPPVKKLIKAPIPIDLVLVGTVQIEGLEQSFYNLLFILNFMEK